MSEITREDALAHFGVKGMKWGVRKAESSGPGRLARGRDKRIEKTRSNLEKAATGKGLTGSLTRVAVFQTMTPAELMRNKGSVRKVAAGREFAVELMQQRLADGTATRLDKLGIQTGKNIKIATKQLQARTA